jgi:hypothetical protein
LVPIGSTKNSTTGVTLNAAGRDHENNNT